MNIIDTYKVPTTVKPAVSMTSTEALDIKQKQQYRDPLRNWPLKGLAYSNEVGAVVSGISPKVGTALWVPALMYIGADVYDKYKNDDTNYNPSKKRGVKEAFFQGLASVMLPTAAVSLGQKVASTVSRFSKTGLSAKTREEVLEHSLEYMQTKSLHTFVDNIDGYKNGFVDSIKTFAQDAKGEFKAIPTAKKILGFINPLKDTDGIALANETKLADYASKQAEKIMNMRADLMNNKCPKGMSKKMFKKFQSRKIEYQKIYDAEKYVGKAAKSILKEFHNAQIFKNKLIKTAGGFIALALLAKPIDDFVENIVIKKTVEPGLDFLSREYSQFSERTKTRNQKKS